MTETPTEETPDERLHDALVAFAACVGGALDDMCSYGLTVGDSYEPFNPDPEDECEDNDDVSCSQAWVRVMGAEMTGDGAGGFGGMDCSSVMRLDLEVGVLRCFVIPEEGEAPTASEVLEAAMQALTDMQAIKCAALACEVWDAIEVGSWVPYGPMGGQYGGMWSFSVEL